MKRCPRGSPKCCRAELRTSAAPSATQLPALRLGRLPQCTSPPPQPPPALSVKGGSQKCQKKRSSFREVRSSEDWQQPSAWRDKPQIYDQRGRRDRRALVNLFKTSWEKSTVKD